jgi:hypothetical protein
MAAVAATRTVALRRVREIHKLEQGLTGNFVDGGWVKNKRDLTNGLEEQDGTNSIRYPVLGTLFKVTSSPPFDSKDMCAAPRKVAMGARLPQCQNVHWSTMAEVSGSIRNGSRAAIFLADKKTKKDKKRQKKTKKYKKQQ